MLESSVCRCRSSPIGNALLPSDVKAPDELRIGCTKRCGTRGIFVLNKWTKAGCKEAGLPKGPGFQRDPQRTSESDYSGEASTHPGPIQYVSRKKPFPQAMETPKTGPHTKGQKQGSQGIIFLEAIMHARLYGQAVWHDDSCQTCRPRERRAIGDAIRVPCRTEHYTGDAGSVEKRKAIVLHETEAGRRLRRGNTWREKRFQYGQLRSYIISSPPERTPWIPYENR